MGRLLSITDDALEDAAVKVLLRDGGSYERACDLAEQIVEEVVNRPMTDAEVTGFSEDDEQDPLGR